MKINTKTRYGIRAMLELAMNNSKESVYQKDIAKNQDISFKYLDQIISALKASGLITTVAGKKSGYILTKKPDDITIYEIYKAFNPKLNIIQCLNNEEACKKNNYCTTQIFWDGLSKQIANYMESVKLIELAEKQTQFNKKQQELMFHI